MLANVGGYALQLQRLEASPAEKRRVCGCEFAKTLDDIFVDASTHRLLLGCRDLARCMLADRLVCRPVRLLAFLRLNEIISVQSTLIDEAVLTQY